LLSLLVSIGSGNTSEPEDDLLLEGHVVKHKDGTAEYVPLPHCVLALLPPFGATIMFALISALLLSLVMKPNPDPAVQVAAWKKGFTIVFVYYQLASRSLALVSTVARFIKTAGSHNSFWEAYQCFGIIFITGPFIQNALLAWSAAGVMRKIHNSSYDWATWDKAVRNIACFLLTKSNEQLTATCYCIPMGTHPDILKEYDEKAPELFEGAYRSERPPTDEEVEQMVELAERGECVPRRPPTAEQEETERMEFKDRLLPYLVKSVVQWRKAHAASYNDMLGTSESQILISDDIDAFMQWRHELCPFEDGESVALQQADFKLAASNSSAWLNGWKMRNFSIWLYVYAPCCLAFPYAVTHLIPGLLIFLPISISLVVAYMACTMSAAKMLNKASKEKVGKMPNEREFQHMTANDKDELKSMRQKAAFILTPSPFEVQWSGFSKLPANLVIIVGVQMLMLSSTYWYSATPWKEAIIAVVSERRGEDYFNNIVAVALNKYDVAARLLTSFT
jgi:hypothetical protein